MTTTMPRPRTTKKRACCTDCKRVRVVYATTFIAAGQLCIVQRFCRVCGEARTEVMLRDSRRRIQRQQRAGTRQARGP
ncbi:MAG: hypothetical protein IVW53_15350 [Chloroflexi bacterium]|nr:hypothetical protein [Chloroflexota bacterium]